VIETSMRRLLKRKYSSSHGFTLIEITIVIFIILLMTSAAVPWMKTFAESSRLRTTARGIRSLMEFARGSAITERTEYVVLFDPTNNEYWLSLKELLSGATGESITDSSRTNLASALQAIAEREATELAEQTSSQNNTSNTNSTSSSNNTSNQNETNEISATRTGGLLGVPSQVSTGIEMAEINSPRSSSGNSSIQYVTFYPDSRAEEFEVYLQSQSGKVMLVRVSETTGRTGIRELTSEDIQQLGLNISDQ
jgi:prepilin-type N-terminal cleavage/methylation domain-containing protein